MKIFIDLFSCFKIILCIFCYTMYISLILHFQSIFSFHGITISFLCTSVDHNISAFRYFRWKDADGWNIFFNDSRKMTLFGCK